MKRLRLLILLAVLSCWTISATCQSSPATNTDVTPVPNAWLRNAAKAIEKGKMDAARAELYKQMTDTLNSRINGLLAIIKLMSEKDTAQLHIMESYRAEIANLEGQKEVLAKEMKRQNKLYRRQKLKTVFAGVGAAGITAAVFILINR